MTIKDYVEKFKYMTFTHFMKGVFPFRVFWFFSIFILGKAQAGEGQGEEDRRSEEGSALTGCQQRSWCGFRMWDLNSGTRRSWPEPKLNSTEWATQVPHLNSIVRKSVAEWALDSSRECSCNGIKIIKNGMKMIKKTLFFFTHSCAAWFVTEIANSLNSLKHSFNYIMRTSNVI